MLTASCAPKDGCISSSSSGALGDETKKSTGASRSSILPFWQWVFLQNVLRSRVNEQRRLEATSRGSYKRSLLGLREGCAWAARVAAGRRLVAELWGENSTFLASRVPALAVTGSAEALKAKTSNT